MPKLADVFEELNALRDEGIVGEYALGGATAMLFYAEPTRTYDLDVFVILPGAERELLTSLRPLYEWAQRRGFAEQAEHILVHGVPVQFLPAHNLLAQEAVNTAQTFDYEGASVRVIGPEHLAALAFQAGGRRRAERAWQLIESGRLDRAVLKDLFGRHRIHVEGDHEL